ncbi:hypothetical protein BCR39DRAFT_526969 [Naematelia encephala]|uniref:RRM domain-containing protein n=1 Tax=Naematelia encephala TaxID=71784 RepID=A0A1Y2B8P4_9TREE|nr:hypothetical protein BCR39DRAFT_526969 [Naematelia encephala]
MSKSLKSGRTPEQQAARDARKAAKAAASVSGEVEVATEADTSNEAESSRKRRRKDDDEENEDELEVDLEAPTPLSKAEARAAKKREKRGEAPKEKKNEKADKPKRDKDGDADDGGGSPVKEKNKAKVKQNSIWIGNLSFKTTQEALRGFFVKGLATLGSDAGEDVVTRINMPKKPGKGAFATENKGFAYVDFATEELQKLAVGLSEGMLEGRRVLIKLGDDHQPKPDARTPKPVGIKAEDRGIVKKQIHPESATLFVGNLPFDATEEGLRDLIESNAASVPSTEAAAVKKDEQEPGAEGGEEKEAPVIGTRGGKNSGLRKVRLGAFEDTGRCKGFAFLDFLTPGHATAALSNRKNHFYSERRLTLQYASESATKRSGGGAKKPPVDAGRPGKRPRPSQAGDDHTHAAEDSAPANKESSQAPFDEAESSAKRSKPVGDVRGKKWEATGRPRPGAALAMAKREKVGIVEGKGEKITFD